MTDGRGMGGGYGGSRRRSRLLLRTRRTSEGEREMNWREGEIDPDGTAALSSLGGASRKQEVARRVPAPSEHAPLSFCLKEEDDRRRLRWAGSVAGPGKLHVLFIHFCFLFCFLLLQSVLNLFGHPKKISKPSEIQHVSTMDPSKCTCKVSVIFGTIFIYLVI